MKKLIAFVMALSVLFAVSPAAADVWVKPYTKKDGTVVKGHYRSKPDGNFSNNWSTTGNINPHTGEMGTKTYEYSSNYVHSPDYSLASSFLSGSWYWSLLHEFYYYEPILETDNIKYDLEQTYEAARQQFYESNNDDTIYNLDEEYQDQYEQEAAELDAETQESLDELSEIGENYEFDSTLDEEYIFDSNGAVKADDYDMEDSSEWE